MNGLPLHGPPNLADVRHTTLHILEAGRVGFSVRNVDDFALAVGVMDDFSGKFLDAGLFSAADVVDLA